jgi:hypothetical protein
MSPCGADASPDRDWFVEAVRANRAREQLSLTAKLSSAWSRRRWKKDGEDQVADLRALRDAVRGFARIVGAPPNTSVTYAQLGQMGAAAAGFDDAPDSFNRPYILLDKFAYEKCEPDEVLDVYCGLIVHEVGHILETRDAYRRPAMPASRRRRVYENLWEDERIEAIQTRRCPGFALYLQVVKRVLLERSTSTRPLRNFAGLPDLDKVELLIFAFVRLPHRIDGPMQSWTAINGECVFETLRSMFPSGPHDEADVLSYAIELERLWERLHELYVGPPSGAGKSPDAAERRMRQHEADAEDHVLMPPTSPEGHPGERRNDELVDPLLDEAAQLAHEGNPEGAERFLERAIRAEAGGAGALWADRAGRRFGLPDLERALDAIARVHRPLSAEESETLALMDRERSTEGDEWGWGSDRATLITRPVPDDHDRRRYDDALDEVRSQVAAMSAVFALRCGERFRVERELQTGRLDRRRLAHATLTDRIYLRTERVSKPGLGLCLLLDESGSMDCGVPSKADVTLRAAVLIVEALKRTPGIELEVYSHTSCGKSDRDCLVRYLYGKENPTPAAIGSYSPKANNYDHQAILTAARLFERNTTQRNRIMLVLSDGLPLGQDYRGEPAVRATRQAAEVVRRRGIRVINIAIDDYESEAIFGRPNVVKFTDLNRLIADMRGLVTRIVRRATESL